MDQRTICDSHGTKETRNSSDSQQSGNVRSKCRRNLKNGECSIAIDVDISSSKSFRKRSKNERSNAQHDYKTSSTTNNSIFGGVEITSYLLNSRTKHG